jgi:hypothetical protein
MRQAGEDDPNNAAPLSPAKMAMGSIHAGKALRRMGKTKSDFWDRAMVARFVDLISKSSGSTLDAAAILKTYDLNGDGALSKEEQTAMIEALSRDNPGVPEQAVAAALERLKSENLNSMIHHSLRQAISFYESLFWYEEPPVETSLFGA